VRKYITCSAWQEAAEHADRGTAVNIIQNAMEAKRELRKAEKILQNFEILSKDLNTAIALLHEPGLKSARAHLERAKDRVARSKDLVKVRIKHIKVKAKIRAAKKRSSEA
jgi:hypothetical protein